MELVLIILFIIALLVTLGGSFALWLVAFIDMLRRKNLKEDKLLYVLLVLLIPVIGVPFYFFKEEKKTLGILSIVAYVLLTLAFVGFMVASVALDIASESYTYSSYSS